MPLIIPSRTPWMFSKLRSIPSLVSNALRSKLNCSQLREQSENSPVQQGTYERWVDRAIVTLIATALIGTPVLVDVHAFLTFEPIKVLFVVGVSSLLLPLVLYRYLVGDRGRFWVGQGWFWVAFGAYMVSLLLSCVLSIAPLMSIYGLEPRYHGLIFHLSLVLIFMAVRVVRRPSIERLLEVTIVTAVGVAVFGVLQKFIPALTQWWNVDAFLGRIFSTLGQPNYLSDYLVLVLPLCFWKYLTSRRWYLWLAGGALLLLALILTLSRSGLIGLFVSFMFFGLVYSWWGSHRRILIGLLVVPLMVGGALAAVNLYYRGVPIPAKGGGLATRFVVSGEGARSVDTRLMLWPTTFQRALERPLFGYGLDTFPLAFSPVAPVGLLETEGLNAYADRAHNILLDTFIERGGVGLLALLGLLGLAIVMATRSRDVTALAMGSALVGHLAAQQFGFQLATHSMLMWFYLGAILTITSGNTQYSENPVNKPKYRRWIVTGLVVVSGGVGLLFLYQYSYLGWRADRLARAGEYQQAYVLAPHRTRYGLATVAEGGPLPGDDQKILDRIERFTGGVSYETHRYRAGLLAVMVRYDESAAEFDRAITLAPTMVDTYLEYGLMLSDAERYSEALAVWQRYLELVPPYWKERAAYERGELSDWGRSRYEIFYKINPNFDDIFGRIEEVKLKAGIKG